MKSDRFNSALTGFLYPVLSSQQIFDMCDLELEHGPGTRA
jgi:hypothetical protein